MIASVRVVERPPFVDQGLGPHSFMVCVLVGEDIRHTTNWPTLEEAERYAAEWTPERLARYASKPQRYWSLHFHVVVLNWLKPHAKRRYRTRRKMFGELLAAVELRDEDFREDITLDWCHVATQWATGGKTYLQHSRAGVFTAQLTHIPQVQAQLESPDCPTLIQKWYREDIQQFEAVEEYADRLWRAKSIARALLDNVHMLEDPDVSISPNTFQSVTSKIDALREFEDLPSRFQEACKHLCSWASVLIGLLPSGCRPPLEDMFEDHLR